MAGLKKNIWNQAGEIKSAYKKVRSREYKNRRARVESGYRNFGNLWKRIGKMKKELENARAGRAGENSK